MRSALSKRDFEMLKTPDDKQNLITLSYLEMMRKKRIYSLILLIVFVALLVSGFLTAEDRNAGGFIDGLPRIFDFPASVLSEAAEKISELPSHMISYFPALVETVNIAAASTLIGAFLAMFLSMFATRGMALWPKLIPLFRRTLDVMRAIPEVVIALVLIFVLGGGPVPAMIAIAFHTTGALGKMFSEVNENASLKPVDGLSSVGANWAQKMGLAVVPQVAPNYLSYALMRFEINIRASAILGFVGAGGIGYELKTPYLGDKGATMMQQLDLSSFFGTIVLFDQLSSHFRDRLTYGREVELLS